MRTDHYYDPAAPKAQTIVVAATVFVEGSDESVLLIRRTDNDLWALPGGTQEIGEYLAETAVRETREEAGIEVEITDVIGIYTNPNHVMSYSDGEVRQQFSICFRGDMVGGKLRTSDESKEVRWIPKSALSDLDIHPSMRLRIRHGFDHRAKPYIG